MENKKKKRTNRLLQKTHGYDHGELFKWAPIPDPGLLDKLSVFLNLLIYIMSGDHALSI